MIKWLKKRKSRSKKNFDLHKRGVAAFFMERKRNENIETEKQGGIHDACHPSCFRAVYTEPDGNGKRSGKCPFKEIMEQRYDSGIKVKRWSRI